MRNFPTGIFYFKVTRFVTEVTRFVTPYLVTMQKHPETKSRTTQVTMNEKLDHATDGTPQSATMPNPEPKPAVEPFIKKPEVAKRLNKTLRTVTNWMHRGILPYYKIGRSVVFKWSDVESHLAQSCRICRRL